MALGPPSYRVLLQRRGGTPLAELPWTALSWSRELETTSSAEVDVPIASPNHRLAWAVAELEAWEFELAIRRGVTADADEEVWVGPVLEPQWSAQGVRISARDVTEWWERRTLTVTRNWVNADLATIFAQFAQDAMAGDPSPGVNVFPTLTGIKGSRLVKAVEHRIAADVLRELARDGLDYTAVGRDVLVGGLEVPSRRLPPIDELTLRNATLQGQGLDAASMVHVLAGIGVDTPVDATAGGLSQTRGLVERVFQEGDILDHQSAQAAAWTRWDALHSMPITLSGDLDARRSPPMAALIPGVLARAQMHVGVRWVDSDVRLSRLQVRATAGDRGMTERVTADFVPTGTTVSA